MNQHTPSSFFEKLVFVTVCTFFVAAGTISVIKGDNLFYTAALAITAILIVASIILVLFHLW